jgi:hypothetical protein
MKQFEPNLAQAMINLIALLRAKWSKGNQRGWPQLKVWNSRCRTSQ